METLANKISTHLENHINLDQNLVRLKRKLEELNGVKEDMGSSIKSLEIQPRKKLMTEVAVWLRNVERINGEVQNLEEQVRGKNLLSRIGNKILETTKQVEDLFQKGKSFDGLDIDDPQWIGQALSTTKLIGQVAEELMNKVWAHLMDNGVSRIGVWGMGGVGKTTIMKLINNQLLKENAKFNIVIWITVSKETSIKILQNRIARAIDVSLSEDDDETKRAGIIYEMMTQKGRYVLILDDVWDKISLEEIGVPEPCDGSKLVVTTRSLDVCRYFGCREIRMPTLRKQDALNLFLEKVGHDVLSYEGLSPIVESVSEQCGGLPLAIVTVASSMKGVSDIHEWRNAFNELNKQVKGVNGLDEKVFQQLMFSYNRLEDVTLKHCFLCCALYPEDYDISIYKLFELWTSEGFMEGMDSSQAELDRAHTILNKLKNNCLLEKGAFHSGVKLHDLVRNMALRITSENPRFLVRAGMDLKELPDAEQWSEDLEKVSLMNNWGLQISPQISSPNCPILTTLLLSECFIKSLPDCFFQQMPALKFLDLSMTPLESLPSVSGLKNLTVLLLFDCRSLEKVPSFSKLKALRDLDLSITNIKSLPYGMNRLVNLRTLKLANIKNVTKIPNGILPNFSSLRHLDVGRTLVQGQVGALRKLEYFSGRFYDVEELNKYVEALDEGPRRYNILVGRESSEWKLKFYPKYIELNGLAIIKPRKMRRDHDVNAADHMIKLPCDVDQLSVVDCKVSGTLFSWFISMPHPSFSSLCQIDIYNCPKMKKLLSFDVLKDLQKLQQIDVSYCDAMEEIIASDAGEGTSTIQVVLPEFYCLKLKNLPELKSICSADGVMVCDCLVEVQINQCPKLKRVPFTLPQLPDNGEPSLPMIHIYPKELWETLEWDQPNAKSLLQPFLYDHDYDTDYDSEFNLFFETEDDRIS
ncbi:hypothetical protein like AT4G27190 [Hibiscus trionum]|uniref:NB-ARC domain-containing protein n=1 Tax=Hibiscus trionum TaxID=183268 RepID=A0A9W7MMT1_HIBTR|nr:hypothetical protein like AT4G27190 [Hibiscus trionum]